MGKTKNFISIYQEDGEGKGKYLSIKEAKELFGGGGNTIAVNSADELIGTTLNPDEPISISINKTMYFMRGIDITLGILFGNIINKDVYALTLDNNNIVSNVRSLAQTYADIVTEPREGGYVLGAGYHTTYLNFEIKAVANPGYHFVRWDDYNTNAERTISTSEPIFQRKAIFEED